MTLSKETFFLLSKANCSESTLQSQRIKQVMEARLRVRNLFETQKVRKVICNF